MPLNNFGFIEKRVNGGLLARCAQPDSQTFMVLKEFGFGTIYKLNLDSEFPNKVEENEWAGGMVNFRPCPPLFKIPSDEYIQKIVDDINTDLSLGRKVIVHCTHGRDRTGLIVGAYRILIQKMSFDLVQKERIYYGAKGFFDNIADEEIVEYLKNLSK